MDTKALKNITEKYFKMSLLRKISILFWTIAVFSYFFQAPITFLSHLIMPFLFLYLLTVVPQIRIPRNRIFLCVSAIYIIYLGISAILSLTAGTPISRIIRFFVILCVIPASFFLTDNTDRKLKSQIFIFSATMKAALLLSLAVSMLLIGKYTPFRQWAETQLIGDIYLISSRPYVQLQGNALLIMAFILEYMNKKKITLPLVLIFLGIMAAGNFAFVLGLICFFGYRVLMLIIKLYRENKLNKKLVLIGAVVFIILFAPYAIRKYTEKMFASNAIRMEQLTVLTDTNPIIGSGLGHQIFAEMEHISYNAPIYFEMQTFYIYNQIGLIGLLLYFGLTLWMAYKKGINRLFIYLIYLFYSFWNPYCFDTTQLFTIVVIFSLMDIDRDYEKDSDYYFVLSELRNRKKH